MQKNASCIFIQSEKNGAREESSSWASATTQQIAHREAAREELREYEAASAFVGDGKDAMNIL